MRRTLVALAMGMPALAWAHGHPANVDPASPDAWQYRLCSEMATVAIQAVHDRDRGRPPKIYPDDGSPAARIAGEIVRRVFDETQISSPKKAEAFGRGYCMESLRKQD